MQFEFWNHPRLFECLARTPFPAMRSVFWSHISGLFTPVIQPGLIEQAGRFVFTTEASRAARGCDCCPTSAKRKLAVINSGFGFADAPDRSAAAPQRPPAIAYLGTVDFVKMHPGFFDAIDGSDGDDIRVRCWGASIRQVRSLRKRAPCAIRSAFVSAATPPTPAAALSGADIFFYPLQRDHYGTAENALIEAMSLGLVPVVLDNPAELAIVRHGETGLVRAFHRSLRRSAATPAVRARPVGAHVGPCDPPHCRHPHAGALGAGLPRFCGANFGSCELVRRPDFRGVIGDNPAEWFLATQCLPGELWRPLQAAIDRSSLERHAAHFESVFPRDFILVPACRRAGQRLMLTPVIEGIGLAIGLDGWWP